MLITRGQSSDWSVKSIRSHPANKCFSINYSDIMTDNYCRKSGPREPVPEAYSQKKRDQMNTTAEYEAYGAENMTANKRVQFQVRLSDAEIEATTRRIADTHNVVNQLEWEIHCVPPKDQMWFMNAFSTCLVQFEAWWPTIRVQELRKTIEQRVIHFGYPKMHLWSHISEWIRQMGSGDNITTDISEWLHISNVKEAYWSSNEVNYIQQMLKHNDRCTGLDFMEETVSYLALQGWYDTNSVKVFNLLAAADIRQIHIEPIFYSFTIVRKSHFPAPYHNRYIIWEKLMYVACAEESN